MPRHNINTNAPARDVSYFTPGQIPAAGTAFPRQPDGKPVPKLFQPFTIRGLKFHNRILLSPLCQYSAENGKLTPWHKAHLGGILTRGPALSIIEATAVTPEGRITPEDAGLWSNEHVGPLADIVKFAHSQNQKIGIQLSHAGRKASTVTPWVAGEAISSEIVGGWPDDVWAPSAIPYEATYPNPKELTKRGITRIVKAFVDAAKRAVKAGIDVIEIHNAHGYLLHSFISPVSNRRTDEYGGSFENRIRLTLEVVDAVRVAIPQDMPLFLRISATDWLEETMPNEESWRSEDTVRLAPMLYEHGVDFLDVSTGGIHPSQKVKGGPAYQAPFAHAVKKSLASGEAGLLVGTVGAITNGELAQRVLDDEMADVILVGRHFQRNPGVVWQFADELGVNIHLAHQIEWGFKGRGKRCSDGKEDHTGREGHKCEV